MGGMNRSLNLSLLVGVLLWWYADSTLLVISLGTERRLIVVMNLDRRAAGVYKSVGQRLLSKLP
jgi:hypothetical protein